MVVGVQGRVAGEASQGRRSREEGTEQREVVVEAKLGRPQGRRDVGESRADTREVEVGGIRHGD
jgi:hypothetical protein